MRLVSTPEPKWITSNGDPLLLLADENLLDWEGTDPPSNGRVVDTDTRWDDFCNPGAPGTDYDRALDLDGEIIEILPVGAGHGLIFPEKATTAWFPDEQGKGGIIYRLGPDDQDIPETISAFPEDVWEEEPFTFTFSAGPLHLFPSAFNGSWHRGEIGELYAWQWLVIDLASGTYRIETSSWEKTGYSVHRFTRL